MKELNERKLEELCEFIGNRVCIRCGDWFDYPIECRTKNTIGKPIMINNDSRHMSKS